MRLSEVFHLLPIHSFSFDGTALKRIVGHMVLLHHLPITCLFNYTFSPMMPLLSQYVILIYTMVVTQFNVKKNQNITQNFTLTN